MLVGESQPMKKIIGIIRQVANSDLNVIISGETGVGKELVARALHLTSDRRNKPLVKVNCAAIPNELLESELFGYEKGAFTGADSTKMGKFELAHEGTILLDEIGDMPLSLQAKMLQVLQDFQFSRLGGKKDIKVDCWVLAATNQDLEQHIRNGSFREDLYYRLNLIKIYIPPLRERVEDIMPLVRYFEKRFAREVEFKKFDFQQGEIEDFFCRYSWPGNVRELQHVVKRLMILGDWETVKSELLTRDSRDAAGEQKISAATPPAGSEVRQAASPEKRFPSLKEVKKKATQEAEMKLIKAVLAETGWNRKKAADILCISYKALLYKIKEYRIDVYH
ncbi:MAG: sigma-54-dependent Fis family transcriptional regulator [Deltaproteobacteria bacterium]|nr:sigma-54-dependent Fis family transcriptional regulator [Deltaproteobacteria bacterium]MBW2071692.1 sigma-54-dependent Fis family transcriptional regulator [Deltaproteobacteria bacterium]